MATTLKAKVDLDVTLAERKLKALQKKLDQTNRKVEATSSGAKAWAYHQFRVEHSLKNTLKNLRDVDDLYADILGKVKGIASIAIGGMTISAAIQTSDEITAAENKLNYMNGGNTTATQESLDKMYLAAMSSRSGYQDMITNVSKNMMLSPKAFKNNIDNAIRFQEIMAKSYTLGGASAQEMSSSLYQLTQALGKGELNGDELRSMTEGAPLAAKAIEAYAQKVYNTTDALKDMGAQGLITADIVVAAMMDAGEGIDKAFGDTAITFAQTGTMIKTKATKTFEPLLQMLNDMLNKMHDSGLMTIFEDIFSTIANALQPVISMVSEGLLKIVNSWDEIKNTALPLIEGLLYGILSVIAALTLCRVVSAGLSLAQFIAAQPWLIAVAAVIYIIITSIQELKDTTKSATTIILECLGKIAFALTVIGVILLGIGLIIGSVPLMVTGLVILIIAATAAIATIVISCLTEIMGGLYGLKEAAWAVISNIGTFFVNLWHSAAASFWEFISEIAKGINDIAGEELFDVSEMTKSMEHHISQITEYDDVSDAWDKGYAKGAAIGKAWEDSIENWGNGIKEKLNFENNLSKDLGLNLDDYSGLLGDIKDDTGNISDSMDISEDLDYLKDLAERDTINRFTTAEIIVDMKNNNNISSDMDIDGIVSKLSDRLYEELGVVAAGVHY